MSKFESGIEGAVDGAAAAIFSSPIEPAQIAKKAEKQMKKEKLVGSGRQYAPTLYNVLVNERDDKRLFGFYPTLASEIENYLYARGTDAGLEFDSRPLVRFIPDPGLKSGRFDVIAEVVAAPIIRKLRDEELEYYGLAQRAVPPAAPPEPEVRQPSPVDARAARRAQAQASDAYAHGGNRQAGLATPHRNAQEDNRFAGLETPAHIENSRGLSAAPPLAQGKGGLESLPGFEAAAPMRPRGAEGQRPAPEDGYALEEARALGQATLYNSSDERLYHLERRKLTIGRGKDNDIVVADANASRVHARFSQDATGKWKLTDLGSTNGVLLNGRTVTSAILRVGDEIVVGTTVLIFTE